MASSEAYDVFISHIAEEKPVALVLQKHLISAFKGKIRVFVASDTTSIGGGQPWFNHIIDNLKSSKVTLVLLSQESKRREWINFEAGFGLGNVGLVIPVILTSMSFGELAYPLAGFQARSVDEFGSVVQDIGSKIGSTASDIDLDAYREELKEAEAALKYKSLTLHLYLKGYDLTLAIKNSGNVDLELLMLELYLPQILLDPNWVVDARQIDRATIRRNGRGYMWLGVYAPRGAYANFVPILRPLVTPSMETFDILGLSVPLRRDLETSQAGELRIGYQIHAVGYNTALEEVALQDVRSHY